MLAVQFVVRRKKTAKKNSPKPERFKKNEEIFAGVGLMNDVLKWRPAGATE
jgi:hypothetical protein